MAYSNAYGNGNKVMQDMKNNKKQENSTFILAHTMSTHVTYVHTRWGNLAGLGIY